MKLLLYTSDDFETEGQYVDFWIDPNEIKAFYFPIVEDGIKCVNLFFCSEVITVVQNQELVDYLTKKFIDNES